MTNLRTKRPATLPAKQQANQPEKRAMNLLTKRLTRQLTAALLFVLLLCGCAGICAEEKQNSPGDLLDACIRAAEDIWSEDHDPGYGEAPGGWGGGPELPAGSDRDLLQGYLEDVTKFSGIPVDYDGRNVQIRMGDTESLHISIPEIRSLSKKIEQFAKDLAGRQAVHMAANKGERLYEPEVIENIYRFAEWMQTLVVEIDKMKFPEDELIAAEIRKPKDADGFSAEPAEEPITEPAAEITLPSFSFDGLVFSDAYVRTEEKDEVNTFDVDEGDNQTVTHEYHYHTTNYYAANGDCIRSVVELKNYRDGVFELRGTTDKRITRIGDTDYFAAIATMHYENPVINYVYDGTHYSVLYKDQEYQVDEECHLLPEEAE